MDRNDGGAAFPVVGMSQRGDQQFVGVYEIGMTLRDYFAAKAMAALIAKIPLQVRQDIAESAYDYADAMLARREA